VARGALLGALLGAQHGPAGFSEWMRTGLRDRDAVMEEITQLVAMSEGQHPISAQTQDN
jgi:hypothetical protein